MKKFRPVWLWLVPASPFLYMGWNIFWLNPRFAAAAVQRNLAKGDTSFAATTGFSFFAPGVPGGQFDPLVQTYGMHIVYGMGDFIILPGQSTYMERAGDFAEAYNTLLIRALVANPDQKLLALRQRMSKELTHMETHDPLKDSEAAFLSGNAGLIDVTYRRPIPGTPRGAGVRFPEIGGSKELELSEIVLTPQDKARFQAVMKRYVAPYNANIYKLQRLEWRKEGKLS